MREYFFCGRDGNRPPPHSHGIEFPDIGAVKLEATRSACEILRDLNHPIETGSELRMEVSDEARRPLFTLRVTTEAHEESRLGRRQPLSFGYMTWSGRHTTAAGFGAVTTS